MEQVIRKSKSGSWYALIVRIILGVVFIVHGYPKLFETFPEPLANDANLAKLVEMKLIDENSADKKASALKLPKLHAISLMVVNNPNLTTLSESGDFGKTIVSNMRTHATKLGWAAALTEFVGGILLLIGFLSRLSALGIMGTMFVAAYMAHWNPDVGFNIFNPGWTVGGGGWEYNAVLGLLAFAVFTAGPGTLSFDRLIFRRKRKEQSGYTSTPPATNTYNAASTKRSSQPVSDQPPRIVSQTLPGQSRIHAANASVISGPTNMPPRPKSSNPEVKDDSSGTGNHGLRPPKKDSQEPPTRPI